jgi:hypothetical protein
VFSAYIYYVVSPSQYERVTSYVKASALVASLLSGVLGDLVSDTYIHTYICICCRHKYIRTYTDTDILCIHANMHILAYIATYIHSLHTYMYTNTFIFMNTDIKLSNSLQLVVEAAVSVTVLMYISAAFVCAGFLLGIFVITKRNNLNRKEGDSPSRSASITSHNPLQLTSEGENLVPAFCDGSNSRERRDNLTAGEATSWWGKRREKMDGKIDMFRRQLQYLHRALQCKPLLALLGLWILGNAVFTVTHHRNCPIQTYVSVHKLYSIHATYICLRIYTHIYGYTHS